MDAAERMVKDALDDLNADGRRQLVPWDPDTSLHLDGGFVDSLDLMDLIGGVEKRMSSQAGTHVSLVDEELFDPEATPFATLGDLVDHVRGLIDR